MREEPASEFTGAVLHQKYHAPATMLTDTDGKPFSLAASTDKRLTLVFFGYTHCPDECPTTMATLASAMLQLDKADRDNVQVVFVTTDPARDTGPVIRHWLDRFDPSFVGVTGPLPKIKQVAETMGVADREGQAPAQRRVRRHPRHPGPRPRRDEHRARRLDHRRHRPRVRPRHPPAALLRTPVSTLFIPSPSEGVWYLGPLPLRGYALCIIAGIVAAVWIGERRWAARGGTRGEVTDIALWAVPFGVIGGRLYHVITDHDLYFGEGKSAINALYVWRGGLGIWGAIALGGVGVWIGAHGKGIRVPPMLDALAPGVLIAQAMGSWGNWFNQELFGRPSTQPWALKIDPQNRPPGYEQFATFQPTFLYESIWDVAAFFFVIWADRRFKLGHGRVMALYVMAYTLGRGWIETLRIDNVEYQHVLGLRLNVWTSIVLFILATIYFVVVGRRHPGP